MNILDTIKPITLLHGHHDNTGTTGSGCFMDVIAYLNGEAQITDSSPCVHEAIRDVMVAANDSLAHKDRQELIRFIPRAMGSAGLHSNAIEKFETVMRMFVLAAKSAVEARLALFERQCGKGLFGSLGPFRQVGYWLVRAAQHPAEPFPLMKLALELDGAQIEVGLRQYRLPRYFEPSAEKYQHDAEKYQHDVEVRHIDPLYETFKVWLLAALDGALPPANEPTQKVIERAEKLVAVHNENEAAKAAKIALARAGA